MNDETIVDFLEDLAKVWNELKPSSQKFLSTLLAGKRRGKGIIFNNIISKMSNEDQINH